MPGPADRTGRALLERELARLADEVARRGHQPDFAQVEARVARNRRTRLVAAGSAVAVLAAVVAIALAPGMGPVSNPPPAPGSGERGGATPGSVPRAVQELIHDDRAHRFEVAAGLDGSLAVIWRNLVQPEPTFALVTRTADGAVTGRLVDAPLDLTAVPGGWVGTRPTRAFFVRPDGSVRDLEFEDGTVEPALGDTLVFAQGDRLVFRGGRLFRTDSPAASHLTGDGVLVTQTGRREVRSDAGGGVVLPADTASVLLFGQGSHVTAVALGDDPDGSVPVLGGAVSSDSGLTWYRVGLKGMGELTSAAVTDGGMTVLAAHQQPALVISPSGEVVDQRKPLLFDQVAAAGPVIFGWTDRGLFVSGDADLSEPWVRVETADGYL